MVNQKSLQVVKKSQTEIFSSKEALFLAQYVEKALKWVFSENWVLARTKEPKLHRIQELSGNPTIKGILVEGGVKNYFLLRFKDGVTPDYLRKIKILGLIEKEEFIEYAKRIKGHKTVGQTVYVHKGIFKGSRGKILSISGKMAKVKFEKYKDKVFSIRLAYISEKRPKKPKNAVSLSKMNEADYKELLRRMRVCYATVLEANWISACTFCSPDFKVLCEKYVKKRTLL